MTNDTVNKGFTIIELLLVIAVVAILGTGVASFSSRFLVDINYDSTIDKTISSVRKARGNAMDGKEGLTWGICQSGNSIRVFGGTCVSPTISEDIDIPSSVSVSGLSEVTFSSRGEPSSTLSITVSSELESETVTVNAAGGVAVN